MQIILNTEYFLVVLNLQGGLNIKLIESGSANEITRKILFGQNRTLKVVLSLKESHSFK